MSLSPSFFFPSKAAQRIERAWWVSYLDFIDQITNTKGTVRFIQFIYDLFDIYFTHSVREEWDQFEYGLAGSSRRHTERQREKQRVISAFPLSLSVSLKLPLPPRGMPQMIFVFVLFPFSDEGDLLTDNLLLYGASARGGHF